MTTIEKVKHKVNELDGDPIAVMRWVDGFLQGMLATLEPMPEQERERAAEWVAPVVQLLTEVALKQGTRVNDDLKTALAGRVGQ